MLLGIVIEPFMLIAGGSAIFLLLVFQVLQGKRKIKFKGPLHMKIHKLVAYALLLFSAFHALVALVYLGAI
jgi:cytochrome b561